jgi:hypothetical protein
MNDIGVNKLYPALCKHGSCLAIADYEFTDAQEDEKGEYKTINIGHACNHHVVEVSKMLKEIYYGNKESNSNK